MSRHSTYRSRRRSSHGVGRSDEKKKNSHLRIANICLAIFYSILVALTLWIMFSNNLLNFLHVNIILAILLVAILLLALLLIFSRKAQVFVMAILIVFSLIAGGTLLGFKSTLNLVNRINETSQYSEVEMAVVVPADSEITSVSDITELAAATSSDSINIETFLENLKNDQNVELTVQSVASYQEAYEKLIAGEVPAMVWSSSYESLLALEDEAYESKIKKIYTYTIKKEKEALDEEATLDTDSFNIYVSGIDTYGSISSVSRSDVNIIMTVNRATGEVLLTTTPRDAYVKIPDGGNNQYDKLTHAGIYGVETSMKTLEELYGIDLDYYVRLNFTSFLKLVDVVGGVEVYNDQAFTSLHGNYDFPVGNITLDSEKALGFVRERKSLSDGDNDRGKNQEKVIAALIKKLTSIKSMTKLTSIISSLEDSVQTNIATDELMKLANQQIETGQSYTVKSQAIEGVGSTGQLTSYAMPNASLYMMQINEDSLNSAKSAIKKVLEGKE